MLHLILALSFTLRLSLTPSAHAKPDLTTHAEKTQFRETGRYGEVETLSLAFERAFPGKVKRIVFGKTPEGRPMIALAASADGTLNPTLARKRDRPVVYFQGGIHAGEIDGKEAGFRILRELLEESAKPSSSPSVLSQLTVLFVPVFNIDGHERFGAYNRPNQVGPETMGWRVTAQNLNLNRDYAKADSPEMQATIQLLSSWDPLVHLDLHVTDGAEFQHDVSFLIQPTLVGSVALRSAGQQLEKRLLENLPKQGHLPLWFYPSFEKDDDPYSGIAVGVTPPRYSQGYVSLRNRIGILVETHSWKPFAVRVKATEDVLREVLRAVSENRSSWMNAAGLADSEALSIAGRETTLAYTQKEPSTRTFDFQGYRFKKVHSEISGQDWIQYDSSQPEVWKIPFFDQVTPKLTVRAPYGGYLVPAPYASLIRERLLVHGIAFKNVKKSKKGALVRAFRATKIEPSKESKEGRQMLAVEGAWQEEHRDIEAGAIFVPIRQRLSHLVLQLMEPKAPDSFVSWGFFNAAFEKREYMEDYVTEKVARELLQKPEIKQEFEARLKADKEFAASPAQRLEFFYRKHPSWDERYGLAPVFQTEEEYR